ncbi:GSCOCG00007409001-RA-CDS, partial [Cotesia congregata]
MDKDNEDNSSSQSHKTDSDDSNLSNVSSVYSDDDPLDMLEHESYKSYSDNSMSEYENSDDSMLEENNNDPNNNMSDENLEGRDPSSPQPGCSRHFDSIENGHANSLASKLTSEQISGIAENILQAITKLLGSVTHESIVEAIQKNITTGNNKLSLQDLLPSEFNLEVTRKRRNSQDVSGVDMKKSRGNSTTPGSPVLAGFLAGNPINIDNLQEMPKYHPVETLTNNNNPNPVANVDKTNYSLPAVNILPSTPLNNPVNLPLQRPAPINNGIIIPVRKNIVAQATTKFTVSDSGERILNRVPDSKPSTVTSKAQVHMLKQQFLQHQLQQQQLHQPQLQHQNLHRVYFNDIINSKSATVGSNANANANDRQKNVDDYFAELRRTKLKLTMEKAKLQQHSHTVKNNHVVINQPVLVPPKKNDAQEAAGSAMVSSKYDQVQLNPSTSNAGSSKVCEEIYQKLRAMFPDIDREYIKTFCPADWAPGTSHDVQFGSIVERILQNEASWVIDVHPTNFMIQEAAENDRLTPNVDDTYEYLTGIFPNADPHFLRSAAEEFKNENDVKTFVDEKLKSHDYPTREQYLAKIKVTEEQQRYTKNFNVEQFLRLIPDPFKHFEDNKRKCEYSLIVLEFLKNVFSRVRVNTISRIYRRH